MRGEKRSAPTEEWGVWWARQVHGGISRKARAPGGLVPLLDGSMCAVLQGKKGGGAVEGREGSLDPSTFIHSSADKPRELLDAPITKRGTHWDRFPPLHSRNSWSAACPAVRRPTSGCGGGRHNSSWSGDGRWRTGGDQRHHSSSSAEGDRGRGGEREGPVRDGAKVPEGCELAQECRRSTQRSTAQPTARPGTAQQEAARGMRHLQEAPLYTSTPARAEPPPHPTPPPPTPPLTVKRRPKGASGVSRPIRERRE